MAYFFHMEKPGWGVVAVIVAGIVLLAVFLVFPDKNWKNSLGSDQDGAGVPMFGDQQTKNMARDTMKVVDGTESTNEIVRGSAEPVAEMEYDRADDFVTGVNIATPGSGPQDNDLAGYLKSVASTGKSAPPSLFASIDAGDFAAVQNILDRGEDIHKKDQSGNSVLHQAANQGAVELGAFLIRYGADVNVVNNGGQTPLDVARSTSNSAFEQLLLAYGARPGNPFDARPVSTPE